MQQLVLHEHQNSKTTVLHASEMFGEKIVQIAAGGVFLLLRTESGHVYGRGTAEYGIMKQSEESKLDAKCESEFVKLDFANIKYIAGGNYFAYYVQDDDKIFARGYNDHSQLGVANTHYNTILSIHNVSHVYCSYAHAVIRTMNDTLYACGYNGEQMIGKAGANSLPLQVLDFPKKPHQRITDFVALNYTNIIAIGTLPCVSITTSKDDHILVASSGQFGFDTPWEPSNPEYTWRQFDTLAKFNARIKSYSFYMSLFVLLDSNQIMLFPYKTDIATTTEPQILKLNFVPSHIYVNEMLRILANNYMFCSDSINDDPDSNQQSRDEQVAVVFENVGQCTVGLQLKQAVCSKTIAMFLLGTPYEKNLQQLLYKRCKNAFTDVVMYFK